MRRRVVLVAAGFIAAAVALGAESPLAESQQVQATGPDAASLGFMGSPADAVTLARVRIIVDGAVALWDASGINRADGEAVDERAIAFAAVSSFFGVEPGSSITARELDRECRLAELRMEASGLFYDATCSVAPARNNPEERTVIIAVSPGFLWRFNGGDLWASIGRAGLGGGRGTVVAWFGWNKNGLRWFNPRVGGTKAAVGVESILMGPGKSAVRPTDEPLVRSAVTVGYSFNPDAHGGLEFLSMTTLAAKGNARVGFPDVGVFAVGPYLSWRRFLPDLWDDYAENMDEGVVSSGRRAATTGGRAVMRAMNVEGALQAEAWSATRIPLADKLACAVKLSAGAGTAEVPLAASFDLYDFDDRCVRSGYAEDELTASAFALASAELRFTAVSARIPPIFPMEVSPFLFCDAAALSPPRALGSSAWRDAYAFGLGTRILFNNPVFAYFSFTYGMNPSGEGRFMFCGTAGY